MKGLRGERLASEFQKAIYEVISRKLRDRNPQLSAIISVTGAEPEIGCYAAIPNEARLKKLMIEHSRNCILLIDHTKFRSRGFCLAFTFEKVNTVVTVSMIDEVYVL